jgi:uncharacterized FlgJ-related protein
MKNIKVLITIIVATLQLSAVCQDKICIEKEAAIRIAQRLDSFDILKLQEKNYINYIDTCNQLTAKQAQIIKDQTFLISSQTDKMSLLEEKYNDCQSVVKITELNLTSEQTKNKKLKTNMTVSLVGGGVLAIGLTTALLVILL